MSKIAGTSAQIAEDKENEEAAMIKPPTSWRVSDFVVCSLIYGEC